MTARVDEAAEEEILNAGRWYEARQAGLGIDLFDQVGDGIIQIEQHPRRFGIAAGGTSNREIRRYRLRRFPYALVYEILPAEIVILAFAHDSQAPGYWSSRKV